MGAPEANISTVTWQKHRKGETTKVKKSGQIVWCPLNFHNVRTVYQDMFEKLFRTLEPYPQWLQQWQNHLTPVPLFNQIPVEASYIHTPLISTAWLYHLRHHPHQNLVQYFLQSISLGFRVGSNGSGTQSAQRNLQITLQLWMTTFIMNYY